MATYEDGTMDVVIDGVECRRPFEMVVVAYRINGDPISAPQCLFDPNEEYMYCYLGGDDRPRIVTLPKK